jgi:hypothetical protein
MNVKSAFFQLSIGLCLIFQSCIDHDYDFDAINKTAHFNIPPVPLGQLDTIFLNTSGYTIDIPEELKLEITATQYMLETVVEGLFNDEVIERFFYDGADDVVLNSDLELDLGNKDTFSMNIGFSILDANGKVIEEIKIPNIYVERTSRQKAAIIFGKEYMKYMKPARSLCISIVIDTLPSSLGKDSYLLLDKLVLNTGGMSITL